MVHQQSHFLHNYKQFLQHDDVEGLRDLFTSHIAGLIVKNKPELVAGLKRIGVTNVDAGISNAQLANNITEAIYAKNKKIIDLVVTMILTTEGQSEYLNDEGWDNLTADERAAKKKEKDANKAANKGNRPKFDGDQITELVGTVGTGLGAIFGIAKSAIDAKKEKQKTKNSINDNINTQQQEYLPPPQAAGMSGSTKVIIAVAVVVVVAGGIGFYFYNRSKAQPAIGGGAPVAQPVNVGAAG